MINYNTNTITGFRNIHKNKDVYVLGSGATLNFIDPKFFYKKITVCVNEVGETYLPTTKFLSMISTAVSAQAAAGRVSAAIRPALRPAMRKRLKPDALGLTSIDE